VEVVRFGFEAVARGDLATVAEYLAPDVVIVQPPEIPDSKTYEGRTAVVDLLEDWPSEWEDFRLELIDLIDFSDDTVVSVLRQSGRGRESGIEMGTRSSTSTGFMTGS
jgi:ketosteroid isomerase-like protein